MTERPKESSSSVGNDAHVKGVYSLRVPEDMRSVAFGKPRWEHQSSSSSLAFETLTPLSTTCPWASRLVQCKQALDKAPYHHKWYAYKGLMNPYELVHVSSNRLRIHENVSEPLPLSRSYFKMWELLFDFDLLGDTDGAPIRTAHFAEGPGGFIEAVATWRSQQGKCLQTHVAKDVYAGITLRSTRRDVPGWGKSKRVLTRFPQIQLHYGLDNTGNLYNVNNILAFARAVGQGACTLATGDGGIDYSIDFANQERLSFRLLLCQLYGAWLTLKRGGHFVCKFFDTYEPFTVELLWMVSITFDVVHIVKPHTSRPANSERYIVAKRFRGPPRPLLSYIERLLRSWSDTNGTLRSIFTSPVPPSFVSAISQYNEWYAERQCRNILRCLSLIDSEPDDANTEGTNPHESANHGELLQVRGSEPPSLAYQTMCARFPDHVQAQTEAAVAWCRKYHVPLNRANGRLSAYLQEKEDKR